MADTAAHLVDSVFPRVPVRQWVLTVPYALRYRLAYDASLVPAVIGGIDYLMKLLLLDAHARHDEDRLKILESGFRMLLKTR